MNKQIPLLPVFNCHKSVQAARIVAVKPATLANGAPEGYRMHVLFLEVPGLPEPFQQMVPVDFINKHNPQAGGYFVRYEDGYHSYSPAEPFERGYRLAVGGLPQRVYIRPGALEVMAADHRADAIGASIFRNPPPGEGFELFVVGRVRGSGIEPKDFRGDTGPGVDIDLIHRKRDG